MNAPLRETREIWLDRLVMLLLAAMAIVPFQHAHHYNPIPSFFAEWWAAVFGLAACAAAFLRPSAWRRYPLPAVLLIPLLLLGALLLQYFFGRIAFVEQGLTFAAYLLWAMLLASLGQDLAQRRGLAFLADGLAAAFVAGALLETIVMVLQIQHAGYGHGWIFPRRGMPWGNLGQPNHLNNYLWLAIASTCYLHARQKIHRPALLAALAILIAASALTGSRSALLYALALAALGGLALRQAGARERMRTLFVNGLALPAVALACLIGAHYASPLLLAQPGAGTLERFYADAATPSIRLQLWQGALLRIGDAPWLGHGVGAAPGEYFQVGERFASGAQPPVAEHTHNLALQLLLEFGAPLTLAVLALSAFWLLRFCRRRWTPERWWLAALLLVTGLHAMLEYPLWYTFFLGPFALLLGAGDEGRQRLANGRRGLAAFTLILILGSFILGTLRDDYTRMERLMNWQRLGDGKPLDWPTTVDTLLDLHRNSLLSPQANLVFAAIMQPVRDHVADRRYVCSSARRFAPIPQIVFKCPLLDALADDPEEAQRQLKRALAAYPGQAALAAKAYASETAAMPEAKALAETAQAVAARLSATAPRQMQTHSKSAGPTH